MVKKYSFVLFALVVALVFSPAAKADTLNFSFTGDGTDGTLGSNILANGTLTATDNSGIWTVIGANVFVGGPASPVSGNGILSTTGDYGADNLIYQPGVTLSSSFVDNGGLLFNVDGTLINLYFDFDSGECLIYVGSSGDGGDYYDTGTLDVYFPADNPTPEPGTLALFGSGLVGLAGLLRRKFLLSR